MIEAGQELGPSSWLEVTQERIDAFADATDDHQSIHVDPELAAQGPFGTTVAHGYLTLSLLIPLWNDVYRHDGIGINYGLNRLRFPAPVPSGSRVRARFRVDAIDTTGAGDAFNGALACAMADGWELGAAIEVAMGQAAKGGSFAGSASISGGVSSAIPSICM